MPKLKTGIECEVYTKLTRPHNFHVFLEVTFKQKWQGACLKKSFSSQQRTSPLTTVCKYDSIHSVNQNIRNHFLFTFCSRPGCSVVQDTWNLYCQAPPLVSISLSFPCERCSLSTYLTSHLALSATALCSLPGAIWLWTLYFAVLLFLCVCGQADNQIIVGNAERMRVQYSLFIWNLWPFCIHKI